MTEKMKNPGLRPLIRSMTAGCGKYLLLGSLAVLICAVASYAIPLVISFVVDYVVGNESVDMSPLVASFVDTLGGREFLARNLLLCAGSLIVLALINGLFAFVRGWSLARASEGVAKTLRDKLYRHLQEVPYDYHKHASTGDLVQRCTSDVDTVRRFIGVQLLEIVRTCFMFIVAAYIMFSLNVPMALISMASLPVLCVAAFVYFRRVRKYFTASDEAEGALSAALQENLTGVRVVRAFGQQKNEYDKLTGLNEHFRNATYKLIKLLAYFWGVTDGLGYVQIAASLIAGIFFAARGELTLGNVLVFVTYTGMLTWPIRQLGRVLADMGKAGVSLGRLNEILNAPVEKEPGRALSPELNGDIEFSHVCFGYDYPDEVLRDVSFKIEQGQTVAILGSTGSGKSSLVALLQRLYTCSSGHIYINGTDINDIDHAVLRRNIAIVLQEPFLYSRTIMENIRIAVPDAPDEEVYAAARIAAVHDVINSFADGYDTVVGERGVTLSGGQQQRVAIARTLMQHAKILVFDDSMSAVDTETDAAIRDALSTLRGKCTTFIISHRITTLCSADKILVLDHGQLVQEGTHEELIKQDGLYRRIATIQDMATQEGGASE